MSRNDWLALMARAARPLEGARFALAVVDPDSGEVVRCNAAMAALVGGGTPTDLADLGERGLVPQAEVEVLRAAVRSPAAYDDVLTVRTRVARPTGPARAATIHVAHVFAVRGDAEAVLLVVDEDDDASPGPAATPVSPPWLIRFLCDADGLVVAVDEQAVGQQAVGRPIGERAVEAEGLLGAHPFVMTHPADVPLIAPIIRALATGEALEAEYVVRATDRSGRWANVRVRACRLHGPAPLLLVTTEPHDRAYRTIEPGLLTIGELEVARAMFAGRRPAQIAALRDVSVRTVRNQINAIYRKLDVANVGELTSRFSLPLRPTPARPRRAQSPRARR